MDEPEGPLHPNPPVHLCDHDDDTVCQNCEGPYRWSFISYLNYLRNRNGRWRQGNAPLRKRRKRLHKKLAKRGFSATPTSTIYSSPQEGYGVRGTKWDWFADLREDGTTTPDPQPRKE